MDIFLTLRAPGQLFVGEGLLDQTKIVKGCHPGEMPWWVMSDILISAQRQFVGIVLYVTEKDMPTAMGFAAASDPKIARFLSAAEAAQIPRYKSEKSDFAVLELRWSSIEPEETEVAQLTDEWYYSSSDAARNEFPSAYGYRDMEHILDSYNITLPQTHY